MTRVFVLVGQGRGRRRDPTVTLPPGACPVWTLVRIRELVNIGRHGDLSPTEYRVPWSCYLTYWGGPWPVGARLWVGMVTNTTHHDSDDYHYILYYKYSTRSHVFHLRLDTLLYIHTLCILNHPRNALYHSLLAFPLSLPQHTSQYKHLNLPSSSQEPPFFLSSPVFLNSRVQRSYPNPRCKPPRHRAQL